MRRYFAATLKGPAAIAIVVALLLSFATAPHLGAAAPSSDFQETGHAASGDFLKFFDSHGGLDIFGYPVTDEIVENGRTVQYFQRARMELWPENPSPYRVQLGLLAVELGKQQPGQTAQPTSTIGARHFPETGHTVAFAFKDFWESRGDLATFGYPITEQLVENGLTVQYFQRARFEWHPENPDGYRVQLGLLGDEYLTATAKSRSTTSNTASAPSSSTPSPSARAGKMVFQAGTGGTILVTGAGQAAPVSIGAGIDPSWSPDGTRVVFAQWDYPAGIYVMNADGSAKGLLYSVEGARSPVWSPDGSRIAFVQHYQAWITKGPMGKSQSILQDFWAIKVLNLADGKVSDLPFNDPGEPSPQPQSFSPSWSPDGKQVVFDGIRGLYVTSEGGNVNNILNTDTRFAAPAWSPDGQHIALMYKQHDHWEIGIIGPQGDGFRLLTSSPPFTTPANNVSPAWSPDGTALAFLSNREGGWRIYVMDADGSNQQKLSDIPFSYEFANERVVSWTK